MGNLGLPIQYDGTGNLGVVKSSIPPTPGTKVDYQLTVKSSNNPFTRWYGFGAGFGELSPRASIDKMGNVAVIESSFNFNLNPSFKILINIAAPKISLITPLGARDVKNSILLLSAIDDISASIIFKDKKVNGRFFNDINYWKFDTQDDLYDLKAYINSNENKTIPISIIYDA